MTNKNVFIQIILIGFLFTAPNVVSATSVISLKLNSNSVDAKINPTIEDKITIEITTDTPVKFNTIAICAEADTVCSRATAVKYFTQTSAFTTTVTKDWNGQKGGAGGAVADGTYKIKVTMAVEGGTATITEEVATPHILVDSTFAGNSGSGGEEENNDGADNNGEDGNDNTGSGNEGSTTDSTISAHNDPNPAQKSGQSSNLKISAGRARLTSVHAPLLFEAGVGEGKIGGRTRYVWAFGDGTSARGSKARHAYRYPGDYVVILTASDGIYRAVARTTVRVTNLDVEIVVDKNVLTLKNTGSYELNIGGFKLTEGEQVFVFAPDTIILSKQNLVLDKKISGLNFSTSRNLSLISPTDEVVNKIGGHKLAFTANQIELEKVAKEARDIEDLIIQQTASVTSLPDISTKDDTKSVSQSKRVDDRSSESNKTKVKKGAENQSKVIVLKPRPSLLARLSTLSQKSLAFIGNIFN
ncbi:MAG: PKD domain-containing protein [Patescibacteria group bacterium]